EESFEITVEDENESPTALSLSGNTITENLSAGTGAGTQSTTDEDTEDSHTYTLVGGDVSQFTIVGAELQSSEVFDYEVQSSYNVTLRSPTRRSSGLEESFEITVEDENESPTALSLSGNTITENLAAGT